MPSIDARTAEEVAKSTDSVITEMIRAQDNPGYIAEFKRHVPIVAREQKLSLDVTAKLMLMRRYQLVLLAAFSDHFREDVDVNPLIRAYNTLIEGAEETGKLYSPLAHLLYIKEVTFEPKEDERPPKRRKVDVLSLIHPK